MAELKHIYRYPVKGLSGDRLETVSLEAGKPIPCDRLYALALAETAFDAEKPEFLRKIHFLMLMRDEKLAELKTEFVEEGHRLVVTKGGEKLLDASMQNDEGSKEIGQFFYEFIGERLKGVPRLVTAKGHMFADVPLQNLSLINLDTVRDIEAKTGLSIDYNRFRGNLIVDGLGAWREFDLIDREFAIGDLTFRASKRIDRCAATNVNLETAERDMNIPLQIRKNFGHIDCGVYVDVVAGGQLSAGDEIKIDL